MKSDKDCIQGLKAPFTSLRLIALEQAINHGSTQELLQALTDLDRTETEEECRVLLPHAITAVRQRHQGKPATGTAAAPGPRDGEAFRPLARAFASGEVLEKLAALQGLDPTALTAAATDALGWFRAEQNPLVAARLITVFAPVWFSGQKEVVLQALSAGSFTIRMAALQACIQEAPQELAAHLPAFLVSPDARLRSLGIQALARIDLKEALLHLEEMLGNPDREIKGEGLRNCLQFPFAEVRPALLKFLAAEKHPKLIAEAGLLFTMNPDPEVPYRLWEIAESAPAPKAEPIRQILGESLRILEKSGIIPEPFSAYRQRFQDWSARGRAEQFIRRFAASWSSKDPADHALLAREAAQRLKDPLMKQVAEEALGWPVPEDFKAHLRTLLGRPRTDTPLEDLLTDDEVDSPALPSSRLDPELFFRLSEEEMSREIAGIEAKNRWKASPLLFCLLEDEEFYASLRPTILRAATRLGMKDFVELSRPWVNSPDPNLAAAAIEYQGAWDPDRLIPLLGTFLKSREAEVKSAALRVLRQQDPSQAVSALMTMLRQADLSGQQFSLQCFLSFDFSLIREGLTDILTDATPDPELLTGSLCLFQMNPAPENLYCLYRLEKTCRPEDVNQVKEARISCQKFLVSQNRLPNLEPGHQEKLLELRWQEEQARKAASPAYALKSLRPKLVIRSVKPQETGLSTDRMMLLAGLWLATAGLAYLFFLSPAAPPPPLQAPKKPVRIPEKRRLLSSFLSGPEAARFASYPYARPPAPPRRKP